MNPSCACHGVPMVSDRGGHARKGSFRCRIAVNEGVYRRRRRLRAWVDQIKIEAGCVDCGYSDNPVALVFDHLDPSVKVATISRLLQGASRARMQAEIDKCEVRCQNCHVIRHKAEREARAAQRQNETADVAAL